MPHFAWLIDTDNYIWDVSKKPYENNTSVREFIIQVCKQLNAYADTYSLEQLKNGSVAHCHTHDPNKANKETPEYKRLFSKLRDINKKLGERETGAPTQIEPHDILQLALPNIDERFRVFGYLLDNIFYLIYIDRYHKVYKE